MNTAKLSIVLLSALVASPAFALGEGFSIKVGRDYDVKASTGPVTAVAIGRGRADVNVGGIQVSRTSVDVGRDFTRDIRAGAVTAVQIGWYGTGQINMGGIQTVP